jgi:deoxyribonuclease-2
VYTSDSATSTVSCLDERGSSVDHWLILKHPQSNSYFYYDSQEHDFHTSPWSLNDTQGGALAQTVKQLWTADDINYVLYNDQPAPAPAKQMMLDDVVAAKYGHTKGLFAFLKNDNGSRGFWLTHSIPLYPLGPQETEVYSGLGSNAYTYAQHILCLTMSGDILNLLAKQWILNRPLIYEFHLQKESASAFPNIQKLVNGDYSVHSVCEKKKDIQTQAGLPLTVFAKTGAWNNDLYAGCVTPFLQDTLFVESWIRGSAIGPVCPFNKHDTLDIQSLDFHTFGVGWPETKDHSKWAITALLSIVCLGDINRMTTQYSRGGGTVCFEDPILHKILKTVVTQKDACV